MGWHGPRLIPTSKGDRKSQRGDSNAAAVAAAPLLLAPTPRATLYRCVMMRGRWAFGSLLMVLHNLESSLGFLGLDASWKAILGDSKGGRFGTWEGETH